MEAAYPQVSPLTTSSIKGTVLLDFLRWYEQQRTLEPLHQAIRAMEPHLREQLDPSREALGILPSTWYPAPLVHALFNCTVMRLSSREREYIVRQAAPHLVNAQFRGSHHPFFSLMIGPDRFARHVQKLWSTWHTTGLISIFPITSTFYETSIRQWSGHHRFLCDLMAAMQTPLFEIMGCRSVRAMRADCIDDGAAECVIRIKWD